MNTLIHYIVTHSEYIVDILMSPEVESAMMNLRKFMFQSVYTNPVAKGQEEKAIHLVINLYEYYEKHIEMLPEEYLFMIEVKKEPESRVICDYVAGMTDRFAIAKFKELFVPISWAIY